MPLSELEAERWQHDLWYRVAEAALGDTPEQVRLDDLPGFDKPAVSRYAATTPSLLRWFKEIVLIWGVSLYPIKGYIGVRSINFY